MSILRVCLAVLWTVAIGLSLGRSAAAETRIALVIGNGSYAATLGALVNPLNDAKLMATVLERVGFSVTSVTDVDQKSMKRAIRELGARLRSSGPDTVGLFYFAGHGFQAAGENWLVPVGAAIASEADADLEAVSASAVLRQMGVAGNRLNIVVLDACRNTPIVRTFRSETRGLARIDAPQGSFVAYATAPGEVAEDGAGSDSPYATALAAEMTVPGVPIEVTFRKVRVRVLGATANRQTPWDSSSVTEEFCFVGPCMAGGSVAAGLAASGADKEILFWRSIDGGRSAADYSAYLDQFPNGTFAGLARARIAELKAGAGSPAQSQASPSAGVPAAGDVAPHVLGSPGEAGVSNQTASLLPNTILPGNTPDDKYNYAFGLLRQASYAEAEQALRAFVQQYPNDKLAGNAQYWLGESLYVRAKYIEAAQAFAEGYQRYPTNLKAPQALLKLAMSLAAMGRKPDACRAFDQLNRQFPNAPFDVKLRAGRERTNAGCPAA